MPEELDERIPASESESESEMLMQVLRQFGDTFVSCSFAVVCSCGFEDSIDEASDVEGDIMSSLPFTALALSFQKRTSASCLTNSCLSASTIRMAER